MDSMMQYIHATMFMWFKSYEWPTSRSFDTSLNGMSSVYLNGEYVSRIFHIQLYAVYGDVHLPFLTCSDYEFPSHDSHWIESKFHITNELIWDSFGSTLSTQQGQNEVIYSLTSLIGTFDSSYHLIYFIIANRICPTERNITDIGTLHGFMVIGHSLSLS